MITIIISSYSLVIYISIHKKVHTFCSVLGIWIKKNIFDMSYIVSPILYYTSHKSLYSTKNTYVDVFMYILPKGSMNSSIEKTFGLYRVKQKHETDWLTWASFVWLGLVLLKASSCSSAAWDAAFRAAIRIWDWEDTWIQWTNATNNMPEAGQTLIWGSLG